MFNFPTTPEEAGKGKLISFIPVKSNVGASTLACYTALSFARFQKANIIDFNPESKVRTYLGYPAETTTVSILDIKAATNPDMIYSASEKYNENINVFPGVLPKIMDISNIDTPLILKAATYLKRSGDFNIVVSGQLHGPSWILPLLSDLIFLVVKPDRSSIDAFREQVEFIARLGCQDRLKIILNQSQMPGGIAEVKNFFTPDIVLPYDVETVRQCNKRSLAPNSKNKNILIKTIQNYFGGEKD